MGERESVMRRVRTLLEEHPERISGSAALILAVELCAQRACIHDGASYIYRYGRHQGYDLPPYPLAGCGEIREFLADQGVPDVPSWYETIGVPREVYHELHHYRLLVCRGPSYHRCALPLAITWLDRLSQTSDLDGQGHALARSVLDCVLEGVTLPGGTWFQ